MGPLEKLTEGLKVNKLSDLKGSPFDNSFNVFFNNKDDNNLIVLGTNGNITDVENTNLEWLGKRAGDPNYSHLVLGNWSKPALKKETLGKPPVFKKTPLQIELRMIPTVLNECFEEIIFSENTMIVTNALLLASVGVDDIKKQLNGKSKKEVIVDSLNFFNDYTLSYAKPKIIFAYGNSEPGDSAWCYLRNYYKIIRESEPIPKTKNTSYKFCILEINNEEVPVIGSPHLSYRYNKLEGEMIAKGLKSLQVI